MPYWEFLIQRENDRAWRPLTSRKLQVFEGNYRIIANTSMSNSAVQTQVSYQNNQKSLPIDQYHAQVISNEGLLVVIPFTHIQTGIWQLNCYITTDRDNDIHEQLCLEVVPQPDSSGTKTTAPPLPAAHNSPSNAPDRPGVVMIHDNYPLVIDDLDPQQIMTSSVANLDVLLADIAPPPLQSPEQAASAVASKVIHSPEEDVLDLSTISIDSITTQLDPSATGPSRNSPAQLQVEKTTIVTDQASDIFAVTDSQFSVLGDDDTADLPTNSYTVQSYEVVVED